jgi:hypothetical protein
MPFEDSIGEPALVDGCENQMMRTFGSFVCISSLRVLGAVTEALADFGGSTFEN